MKAMATDESHEPVGRYARRRVEGHGVVRAVWVRDAGALVGSSVNVVARTHPAVVLHVDGREGDRVGSVEVRAAGRRTPGALTHWAIGFDAHPWATPEQLAALELAVRSAGPDVDLDAIVRAVLARSDAPVRSDAVSTLAAALESTPDRTAMRAVLAGSGSSARTIRRRFAAAVGMSADRYRVVARASLARHRLVTTTTPLATLAHELGYSDQSHLHRDVLELSGSTPTAWRERRHAWRVAVG